MEKSPMWTLVEHNVHLNHMNGNLNVQFFSSDGVASTIPIPADSNFDSTLVDVWHQFSYELESESKLYEYDDTVELSWFEHES